MARPPRLPQTGPSIFDAKDEPVDPSQVEPAPRAVETSRRLIVEADGGSRGNPGPAAYGAVVRDPQTGQVLDSEGVTLGVTTNNVAEYSGLIAGLEMARALDPGAAVEVRMDSRLVIEQMAGRWKVKHPGMRPLALKAQSLRPPEVTWTWVPRAENKAADALVNAALDGNPRTRR
jgi:probable phosphoglycerate mutase